MERHCRFCLDSLLKEYDSFIRPCACRGTSEYVHESCLRKWALIDPDENAQICPVCNEQYTIDPLRGPEHIPDKTYSTLFLDNIVIVGFTSHYVTCIIYYRNNIDIILQMKCTTSMLLVIQCIFFLLNFQINNLRRYRSHFYHSYAPFFLVASLYFLYRIMYLDDVIHSFIINIPMNFVWVEHLRILRRINAIT